MRCSAAALTIWPSDARAADNICLIRAPLDLLTIESERLSIQRNDQGCDGESPLRYPIGGALDLGAMQRPKRRRGLDGAVVTAAIRSDRAEAWSTEDIHHAP